MKKLFLILLAGLLILSLGCSQDAKKEETPAPAAQSEPAPAEKNEQPAAEPEPTKPPAPEDPEDEPLKETVPLAVSLPGDWYAEYKGMTVQLTLKEDGSYTLVVPGIGDPTDGDWSLTDDLLYMDGDTADPLVPLGSEILWESAAMRFTKEKPEIYAPAEVNAEAKEGSFNGYWKAKYIGQEEAIALASALGDDTDLYIEGTNVALGGSLFGDIATQFTLENGALTLSIEGAKVTIELLKDGLLRLTLDTGKPAVLYLELDQPIVK